MDMSQFFVPGVITAMVIFMAVLGATAFLTRN